MSHPTWVRGLKLIQGYQGRKGWEVAPYVGAWIETRSCWSKRRQRWVAPYVGAWIETEEIDWEEYKRLVAPYVGAWIETLDLASVSKSLSLSHPTWVRGLKQVIRRKRKRKVSSHPTWVRGLKLFKRCGHTFVIVSHPTWVRGLKLYGSSGSNTYLRRTLRGCVDWNQTLSDM